MYTSINEGAARLPAPAQGSP